MTDRTYRKYQDGEEVRLCVTGEVKITDDGPVLQLADGHSLPLADPALPVDVTFVTPADGAPHPGQLWADALGGEWFAQLARGGEVWMTAADGTQERWQTLHEFADTGPIRLLRQAPGQPGDERPGGE
ncbi:hypothetical protein [Nonomuraea aridisoli]|uniref:Uncharacterized protein n=1 Tax=Nonomuraea aridisoli TaxID=2070368 RepID=A0A2W2FG83_9ACTN|nr:hypothetical protein [Nonomuraea aridisoli]PZG20637.1 hypothetical protein C1J01_09045 [Nonomuraea aridisoli]